MKIFDYSEIDSTNLEAKRLVDTNQIAISAIVKTKLQTAGRGRFERIWKNKEGNIAFSVVFPKKWVKNINILPAVACIAVRNCITPNDLVKLKWPNDLLVCKDFPAKFCGILIENIGDFIIVGIGVNVLWSPENVIYNSTNLIEYGLKIESEEKIAKEFFALLNKNSKEILQEWERNNYYFEKQVDISGKYGIFMGVDENFAAQLMVEGDLIKINYGDVS